MNILTSILIGFLTVQAGWQLTRKGHLLYSLAGYVAGYAPSWMQKIFHGCIYCMSNPLTWGGLGFWLSYGVFELIPVKDWYLVPFQLVGYCIVVLGAVSVYEEVMTGEGEEEEEEKPKGEQVQDNIQDGFHSPDLSRTNGYPAIFENTITTTTTYDLNVKEPEEESEDPEVKYAKYVHSHADENVRKATIAYHFCKDFVGELFTIKGKNLLVYMDEYGDIMHGLPEGTYKALRIQKGHLVVKKFNRTWSEPKEYHLFTYPFYSHITNEPTLEEEA